MLILVAYDVSTDDQYGKKRLRKVAKYCMSYGQRVQNSLFECSLDSSQYKVLRSELIKLIDKEKDSLRFYNLGNNYKNKIFHYGTKETYQADGLLMV